LHSQKKMHLLFTFSYNLASLSWLDTGENEFNSECAVTLTPLCTHTHKQTNTHTHIYIYVYICIQGGSNMTGTDLYVNKPHCAAAVRP